MNVLFFQFFVNRFYKFFSHLRFLIIFSWKLFRKWTKLHKDFICLSHDVSKWVKKISCNNLKKNKKMKSKKIVHLFRGVIEKNTPSTPFPGFTKKNYGQPNSLSYDRLWHFIKILKAVSILRFKFIVYWKCCCNFDINWWNLLLIFSFNH